MTIPLVAIGHDVALVDLDPFLYMPRVDPAAPVDREYAISGATTDLGFYVCFHWDFFEDEADYQLQLGQFDLETNEYADVTIFVKDRRLAWTRFNGKALLPEMGADIKQDNFFIRNVVLYVVDLEVAA